MVDTNKTMTEEEEAKVAVAAKKKDDEDAAKAAAKAPPKASLHGDDDEDDPTRFHGLSAAERIPDGPTERVKVVKSFQLHRDDGTTVTYTSTGTNCDGEPGEYEMAKVDADHWFAQAHFHNPPPPIISPQPGTMAHAEMMQRGAARQRVIDAALQQEEDEQLAEMRDNRTKRARRALGSAFEKTDP